MEEKIAKCFFCNKSSKYTCPQCLVRYCSTDCYKCNQHLECSENFYKEQVIFLIAPLLMKCPLCFFTGRLYKFC